VPIINRNSRKRPWIKIIHSTDPLSRLIFENIYHTTRWEKLRKQRLMIEPLCRECMKRNIITIATVVDHVIPIKQGGPPWKLENTQSMCEVCHNKKRREERDGYK